MERGKHVYVQKPLVRTVWKRANCERRRRNTRSPRRWEPGLLQRRYTAVRRDDLERRYRQCHRSARLERPADVAARANRDSEGRSGAIHSRLGSVARHRRQAALYSGRQDRTDRNGGFFYQPFNWRGFYDFGCGALAIWPATFWARRTWRCICPIASSSASSASRRKAPARSCFQGLGSAVRFCGLRRYAGPQDLLVRRPEGDSQNRRRSGWRVDRRSAYPPRPAGGRGGAAPGRMPMGPMRPPGNEFRSPAGFSTGTNSRR